MQSQSAETAATAQDAQVKPTKQAKKIERGDRFNPQPLEIINIPGALLRITTIARLGGASPSTVARDIAAGKLKVVKIGARCTRATSENVREWLAYRAGAAA